MMKSTNHPFSTQFFLSIYKYCFFDLLWFSVAFLSYFKKTSKKLNSDRNSAYLNHKIFLVFNSLKMSRDSMILLRVLTFFEETIWRTYMSSYLRFVVVFKKVLCLSENEHSLQLLNVFEAVCVQKSHQYTNIYNHQLSL